MTTNKVALWMREEHAKVQALADKIREKTAVVPRANLDGWITEVRDRFEHLRAHSIKHMALEEHEGYLTSVVEQRPALAPEVERLKREHQELTKLMNRIHLCLAELTGTDRLLIRDCCARIGSLLSYIEHHEDDENLLVTYAYTQDIGTSD